MAFAGDRPRRRLEAAGADVLYREAPVMHGIDPSFIGELQGWLAERTRPEVLEA